jgi:tetratricopeptide (TPR) repeat protein
MKAEEKEHLLHDDRFVQFMSGTWDMMQSRRRIMLFILAVIVGIGAVIAVTAGMSEVRLDRRRSSVDMADTIEEKENVADEYPDAVDLLISLGTDYALRGREGDLDRAAETLRRALDAAEKPLYRALAAIELGKVNVELGRYDEALRLFDEVADTRPAQPLLTNEADWHAARCLELLGRHEEAATRYARIGTRGAGGIWQALAEFRRIRMRQSVTE